ncbi:hypothetical protein BDN72DRAFT_820679 [Pluteus cervinus]|uniref:Uncharacterized protein n=1 Tax=Pluteus cervinus TaxID=181527 RepID=A0ACD3AT93_9AGAR|nr:hypothetical protein BDN72DRAFT_820679 [Pluteus cervinus]
MALPLKALYDKQGFVIVPGLVRDDDREELEMACDRVIARTRAGQWPYRRTVGKQFPPYGNDHPDSWGVQHVMHPDLGEPCFVRWYTSLMITEVARELLECGEEDLQMELFNLLINPLESRFALRWHRDDVGEKATEEEEKAALEKWRYGVQWNTALYRDACLFLVPGSHRMPRTPEQRALSETMDPPEDPLEMPGSIQLVLQPGETVFYNSNILHCAAYEPGEKRATLHATMGDAKGGSTRARNVLQHGLEWMKEVRFREDLDEKSVAMLDLLLKMHAESGDAVGFSLEN